MIVAKDRAIKFVCPIHGEQALGYMTYEFISLACGCWWEEVRGKLTYKGDKNGQHTESTKDDNPSTTPATNVP